MELAKKQEKERRKRPYKKVEKKKKGNNFVERSNKTCNEEDSEDSLDEQDIICCVCRCGVDFSEQDAFTQKDGFSCSNVKDVASFGTSEQRKKGNDTTSCSLTDSISCQGKNDEQNLPKLPHHLYDQNNAILICDSCDRCYHQRCHFVPLLSIPRGNWYCLICQYKNKLLSNDALNPTKKRRRGRPSKKQESLESKIGSGLDTIPADDIKGGDALLSVPLTVSDLNKIYPPISTQRKCIEKDGQLELEATVETEIKNLSSVEDRFEYLSAPLKSHLLERELFVRIKSGIDQNLSRVRLSQNSIRAYTETSRARKAILESYGRNGKLPQEFVQSVFRMAQSKLSIRGIIIGLHKLVRNVNDKGILQQWISDQKQKEITSNKQSIEIDTVHKLDGQSREVIEKKWEKVESTWILGTSLRKEPRFDLDDYDGSEEDSECLDKENDQATKCTVCFSGHTEEQNDVVMCDGEHCFRAMHMKCVSPVVTQEKLDSDVNGTWFCPFCTAFATMIHHTQVTYYGDGEDEQSQSSWEKADEVFPEAEKQMMIAKQWKRGHRDEISDELLSNLLGIQVREGKTIPESVCIDQISCDESTDDSDVSNNDLSGFSSSSCDEDSVLKWDIDKSEVDALSSCSSGHSTNRSCSESQKEGRRKAQRRQCTIKEGSASSSLTSKPSEKGDKKRTVDIGTLDVTNIVRGKRNRTKVDYIR
jgi:hypothetical protein